MENDFMELLMHEHPPSTNRARDAPIDDIVLESTSNHVAVAQMSGCLHAANQPSALRQPGIEARSSRRRARAPA